MTTLLFTADPVVQPLAWTLVHFLWQGTLVALGLGAVLALTRRNAPQVRYAAAIAALLLLAVLPIVTASVLLKRDARNGVQPKATASTSSASLPVAPTIISPAPGAAPAGPQALLGVRVAAFVQRTADSLRPALPWLVAAWLAGISALSLIHLAGWWGFERLRRRATLPVGPELEQVLSQLMARLDVRRPVRLLQSALVAVPSVAGWAKPLILIPASALTGMTPGELESVIAHELAHVRRHDYIVNLFQALVEIVLFYHPAVWWVSQQVRVERELCCDDLAVAACGDPVRYARALAHLEGLRASVPWPATAATSGGRGTLLARIRRLVGARSSTPESRVRTWAVAALGTAAILSLGATAPLLRASGLPSIATVGFAPIGMAGEDSLSGARLETVPQSTVSAASTLSEDATTEVAEPPTPAVESDEHSIHSQHSSRHGSSASPGPLSGEWRTHPQDNGSVWLELRREWDHGSSSNSFDIAKGELNGLGSSARPNFELRREAGTLHFTGESNGDGAHGTFVFEPSPRFRDDMKGLGYRLDDEQMFSSAALNLTTAFVHEITESGQRDPSFDRLIEFRIHGVSGAFIKELAALGYPNLPADRLVEFRIHGVTAAFIRDLSVAGYPNPTPDRLVEFRIHGVSAEFVKDLAALGYPKISADRLVEFKIHGVTAAYIKDLAAAGYTNLSADRLVEFRIHGVTPEFVRAVAQSGYHNVSADRLVEFRIHNVTPALLHELAAEGYHDISSDRLVEFAIHNVTPEYVKSLNQLGYQNISADRLVEFRIHGVDPEELRAYAALGYSRIPEDVLVAMRIHGVTPELVHDLGQLGYRNIDPEKLIEMRIHNVDPTFIKEMEEHGHRGASIDELIRLRIHNSR